jgi:EF hand
MNFKLAAAIGLVSTIIVGAAFAQKGDGEGARAAMNAPQTRAEAQAKVKALFGRMDADRNGTVTSEEAKANRAARRTEMRDRRFEMMDTNKDGSLSKAEFDQSANMREGKGRRGAMAGGRGKNRGGAGMGRHFDTNGDGTVTEAEMTAATMARFDMIDANKDGTVTPDERRAHRQNRWQNRAK